MDVRETPTSSGGVKVHRWNFSEQMDNPPHSEEDLYGSLSVCQCLSEPLSVCPSDRRTFRRWVTHLHTDEAGEVRLLLLLITVLLF